MHKKKGIIVNPDKTQVLKYYINAGFASCWHCNNGWKLLSIYLCTSFIIKYDGVPILWFSEPKTNIAPSTIEAYISLSTAARELIPIVLFMEKLSNKLSLTQIGFKL